MSDSWGVKIGDQILKLLFFRFLSKRNYSQQYASNIGSVGYSWNRSICNNARFIYQKWSRIGCDQFNTGSHSILDRKLEVIIDREQIFLFRNLNSVNLSHPRKGFMLVYSIASRDSFAEMKAFREQIHKVKASDKVPIVLGWFPN